MYGEETYSWPQQHAYTFPPAGYTSHSSPYLPEEFAPPKFHRAYTYPTFASSTSSLHSLHSYSTSTSLQIQSDPLRGAKSSKTLEKLVRAVKPPHPDRSKRFLNSKLYFSSLENDGRNTFVTLRSSNLTWGTLCNSLTLGLTAPLCRVYFVELMFQDRIIHPGSWEATQFLQRELGFKTLEGPITGEILAHWLEGQQRWEYRTVSFEKMQGNCFAVYCIAVPNWSSMLPDALTVRGRAAKRYQILDGVDSVLLLMGRFHNSVWALFK